MCFHISLTKKKKEIEERFNASFDLDTSFTPNQHFNAFNHPKIPVITNDKPRCIQMFNWGLIPHWVKDWKFAKNLRVKTLNSRSETISEKPSFRRPIKDKHCLIIADGFYEWRHEKNNKIKHHIHLPNKTLFAFVGIWDKWINNETGKQIESFSIITQEATGVMSYLHNSKNRQPIIINENKESDWLDTNNDFSKIINSIEEPDIKYNLA